MSVLLVYGPKLSLVTLHAISYLDLFSQVMTVCRLHVQCCKWKIMWKVFLVYWRTSKFGAFCNCHAKQHTIFALVKKLIWALRPCSIAQALSLKRCMKDCCISFKLQTQGPLLHWQRYAYGVGFCYNLHNFSHRQSFEELQECCTSASPCIPYWRARAMHHTLTMCFTLGRSTRWTSTLSLESVCLVLGCFHSFQPELQQNWPLNSKCHSVTPVVVLFKRHLLKMC